METEFKTTFIPKKPLTEARSSPSASRPRSRAFGLLNLIATLIFLVTLVASAGVYLYKTYLTSSIENMKVSIDRAEKAFEPALIVQLQNTDKRLRVSDALLKKHIVFSPLFRYLEQATLPEISFTGFEFVFEDNVPTVKMKGVATRYIPIAQQSQIFNNDNVLADHIFSNFSLTDTGRVSFDLSFTVPQNILSFEQYASQIAVPVAVPSVPESTTAPAPVPVVPQTTL